MHLAQARSEHDNLVYLSHAPQKLIHSRPLQHVEVVPVGLNLHGYDVVW